MDGVFRVEFAQFCTISVKLSELNPKTSLVQFADFADNLVQASMLVDVL